MLVCVIKVNVGMGKKSGENVETSIKWCGIEWGVWGGEIYNLGLSG